MNNSIILMVILQLVFPLSHKENYFIVKALLEFVKFPCREQEMVVSCTGSSNLSFNRYINEISG